MCTQRLLNSQRVDTRNEVVAPGYLTLLDHSEGISVAGMGITAVICRWSWCKQRVADSNKEAPHFRDQWVKATRIVLVVGRELFSEVERR